MKMKIFLILFLVSVNLVLSKKVGVLPEVMKPDMIEVGNERLYIVEGPSISIYRLKDLKPIISFGKKGEGPGEFAVTRYMANWVKLFPDYLLVNSYTKISKFSYEGKFINEKKKNVLRTQLTPIGKNFVAKASRIDRENNLQYIALNLYNSNMEKIKELYSQRFIQQGRILYLIMDFLNFRVYDDKIFVEESPDGFIIDVFDSNGKKLYRIDKEFKKIMLTNNHKEEAFIEFKQEPTIRDGLKRMSWEQVKNRFNFVFPKFLPAIQNIEVNNKRIYVKTFYKVNNKEEYIVIDLKGKVLRTVYLPKIPRPSFWHCVLGVKLDTIKNNKFYYLHENEDDENWELHIEKIIH